MRQGGTRGGERGTASRSLSPGMAGGIESQDADPGGQGGRSGAGRLRSLLSPDQSWWWDGRRWVSATTADGLWAWNGRRWRTTVELEGKPPEEMADVLTELVEDGYIEAGRILVARSPEWEPEGELGELV